MDENRKNIIVKEIHYWKDNKMLPEQYCNYLLALYTEGNPSESLRSEGKGRKRANKGFLFLTLIPLSVFILYFTELSFDLQIALSILSIIVGIGITYYFFRKGFHFQLSLVITALISLLLSVELTVYFSPNMTQILYLTVLANCILWIFMGKKLKLLYFVISGYLGIIVLAISIFV